MKNSEFIDKLKDTVRHFNLLQKGDRVLAAVSGGPDSVALLYGLLSLKSELDLELYIAHLNHKLRGVESDKDERFVKALAKQLKLDFFSTKIDVIREAKKQKLNLEECAREIRYRYLDKIAGQIKADKIATGHQADDQAETFLMRLIRGAGGTGLSGIPPQRGKIIRPLIRIKREEIESFLKVNKIISRSDLSNYLPDHFRNKIRLILLPKIKKDFNPQIIDVLNRTADIISSQQEYIEKTCERILHDVAKVRKNKIIIDLKKFTGYDICLQRELIRQCVGMLKGDLNQLSFDAVDRSLDLFHRKRTGKKIRLASKIWLEVCEKELIVFKEGKKQKSDYPLTLPGEESLIDWGIKIKSEFIKCKPAKFNNRNQNIAFLDQEKQKLWRISSRILKCHLTQETMCQF